MQTLLTTEGCRGRQQRLRAVMESHGQDIFITGHARTIYYLTGALLSSESPAALVLRKDGQTTLISPLSEAPAADECIPIETYSIARIISDAHSDVANTLKGRLGTGANRSYAVELSYTPASYLHSFRPAALSDAGPQLRALRKRKDEDEIAEIRRSLGFSRLAYQAAKAAIQPGVTELEVHDAMFRAAAEGTGQTFTFSGDFACGLRCVSAGGPPTTNQVHLGDLYILDLFPACAFYYGDTCRTFCAGEPTDEQQRAWELVSSTLHMAATMVRPGLQARELYGAVRDKLAADSPYGNSFWHHAGHGVGLHGHESPRLIPGSDEVIEAGDVIAIEPAVYSEHLQGGIRLENTYIVRESGAESLFDFPLSL